MHNLRSAAFALAGLAFVGIAAAFAVSLTLIIAALLTVTMAVRMLMPKVKRQPVYARARRQENLRVWNDGKGTIIDL